ncbi:hypothetical protein L1887_18244 [Cichorium endivia]|nr:hypothetical protein L1887_18244 [Cichorium endivia]
MGETKVSSDNRLKPSSRFGDENQPPSKAKNNNVSSNLKPRSIWGSNIVKGFSNDKKTRSQQVTKKSQQQPVTTVSTTNSKNPFAANRAKRSLIGDLSCSVTATQVHPQGIHNQCDQNQRLYKSSSSSGSRDLFAEIDQLRSLLQASKDREAKLQGELSDFKRKNLKALELERVVESKTNEIDGLKSKIDLLESENASLSEQLNSHQFQENITKGVVNNVEVDVLKLRRLNAELHLQKRNLCCRISSMESQLASLAKDSENEFIQKIKSEASMLRQTNEDLCKQVEDLQVSRLNEVEELVYLRWVNSCLKNELQNSSFLTSDITSSPASVESQWLNRSVSSDETSEHGSTQKRQSLIKKWKKWPVLDEESQVSEPQNYKLNLGWLEGRRHSISGANCCQEDLVVNKRRQSDGFISSMEIEEVDSSVIQVREATKLKTLLDVEKRALRVPNPPPRPSSFTEKEHKEVKCQVPPPPPPPPPPPKFKGRSNGGGVVQRAPQVVEFYHSLMKRDSRKDSLNDGICDASEVNNVRNSMIGEIENRSSHLLAIKEDVETQGEFVNSLIREVNDAVYPDIEDVVAFVKWLDDELCFLVDERAVLKHFDWPEKKADTLREAAFAYRDLKKLEHEISNYKDNFHIPCDLALKKMVSLSEKMERIVYNLLRTRDVLMRNCKEFHIPTDWMLDTGILNKIKLGSVKLAKQYMRRVATELQTKGTSDKDSSLDYMLLQGVRFAFRIHQFAGGFDVDTMHAFEELRNVALVLNKK